MNELSRREHAREDAEFLRGQASSLSYNDSECNAIRKHRFYEIAMRISTGFYTPKPDEVAIAKMFPETGFVSKRPSESVSAIRDEFTAPGLLSAAEKHMRDRAATYDKPEGERSMGKTIEAFNTITGRDLRESDGWLLLALLKMVRSEQRQHPHQDSVEDLIAYAALFGEARLGGK